MNTQDRNEEKVVECPGPLVWFQVFGAAILECATCNYMIVTGNFNDEAHSNTPILREGLVS